MYVTWQLHSVRHQSLSTCIHQEYSEGVPISWSKSTFLEPQMHTLSVVTVWTEQHGVRFTLEDMKLILNFGKLSL
jgi:hypothetical protein